MLALNMALPNEEEVGQLRVMNVVKKWRVSNDSVDCPLRDICAARIPARKVNALSGREVLVSRADVEPYALRESEDFRTSTSLIVGRDTDLERILGVLKGPPESSLKKGRECA